MTLRIRTRWFQLLLVAALIFSLAGCGNGDADGQLDRGDEQPADTDVDTDTDDPTTPDQDDQAAGSSLQPVSHANLPRLSEVFSELKAEWGVPLEGQVAISGWKYEGTDTVDGQRSDKFTLIGPYDESQAWFVDGEIVRWYQENMMDESGEIAEAMFGMWQMGFLGMVVGMSEGSFYDGLDDGSDFWTTVSTRTEEIGGVGVEVTRFHFESDDPMLKSMVMELAIADFGDFDLLVEVKVEGETIEEEIIETYWRITSLELR